MTLRRSARVPRGPYNCVMRIAFPLLIALAALTGCGFKGPLYMPAAPSEGVRPAAPPRANNTVPPGEQRPVPSEATPAPQ